MIEMPAEIAASGTGTADKVRERTRSAPAAIVPASGVAGNALVLVIAIMSFLSCLTLGAVAMVRDTAMVWQTQIAREATIQIKPTEGLDIEASLAEAARIAGGFAGVTGTSVVDREATGRLLEPWLGTGLDFDDLPVPRLVVVTIDRAGPPDFGALRAALTETIPGLSLDDHRTWVDRLVSMSRATVTLGMAVLGLILSATVLTVVFATRGAMAGNGHIIEVLHFVGAEAKFIAAEFRNHFLLTGIKGAAAGGAAALLLFLAISFWSSRNLATPEADQAMALFGDFAIGASVYGGVALIVLVVAMLTAATSHVTVIARLHGLEVRQPDG